MAGMPGPEADQLRPRSRSIHPLVPLLGALVLVGAGAAAAWFWYQSQQPESRIVGKWVGPANGAVEYFSDGTVVKDTVLVKVTCRYKFLDRTRLQESCGGLLGSIVGDQIYKVSIDASHMTQEDQYGNILTYMRQ